MELALTEKPFGIIAGDMKTIKLPRGFKLPAKLHDRVEEIYHDDDGWWCILQDGWQNDGCIGIREDTKARLVASIRDARPGEIS